jgi:sugar phosphate isomerase/epimerase
MNTTPAFHSSLECAQHGNKSLQQVLGFALRSGAHGVQPSNFHLQDGDGFKTAKEVKDLFGECGLHISGFSAHCPFWVHTTAWTESLTIRRFIPEHVAKLNVAEIEQWAESYILRFLDLCAELNVKIVPMFWGTAFGLEVSSGYPWGMWNGPGYDLIEGGKERFADKTMRIRAHANNLRIRLCHEIHPGTAATCADDFLTLVDITDEDPCIAVNADPSHCWEGESWRTRFTKVGQYISAAHIKDFRIIPGLPLRSMKPDWPDRGMQFVPLGDGDGGVGAMRAYAELLIQVGYQQRYCEVTGQKSAPLVVEAESAFWDLDTTSAHGIKFVNDHLTLPRAMGSFEDGMGEQS